MSEPTPPPAGDDPKKRLREKVEKLLTQGPYRSTGSTVLNGQTFSYNSVAEFIPVVAGGVDEKRGEVEAAVFMTAYLSE